MNPLKINKYDIYKQPDPIIGGWMDEQELQWLYLQAQECKVIVEIGSWRGRSTHALLTGNQKGFKDGTVYAVDHWKGDTTIAEEAKTHDIYAEFMKNVGYFPNLKVIKSESTEAYFSFEDKSVDMVFVDGNHGYFSVKQDVLCWRPKAKGVICGHDFTPEHIGLTWAVKELLGIYLIIVGSIWIHLITPESDTAWKAMIDFYKDKQNERPKNI